ncbi:MAG: hypothetical protein JO091_01440 [Acidobacteriaceae bacterium]|nr:hypothetical protein [Acidobacteriaceae bacterium]
MANVLFLAACFISFAQALIQYKPLQRYLLSFGLDFWGEILLLIAFCIWIFRTPLPENLNVRHSALDTLPLTAVAN